MTPNEDAALELLVHELGLTPVDEQAEFIRQWNALIYDQAAEQRENGKPKRRARRKEEER